MAVDGTDEFSTETPLEVVWQLLSTEPGIGRWLGATATPATDVAFRSPVAPQISGRIRVCSGLGASGATIRIAIADRDARIEVSEEGTTTTLKIVDPQIAVDETTAVAWATVVAAARQLIGEFHRRDPRQAVVLIHGIGEQRPGTTIASFVESVAGSEEEGDRSDADTRSSGERANSNSGDAGPQSAAPEVLDVPGEADEDNRSTYWSKPDRLAETMELRRYQAAKTDTRPKTDFYEYYWANEVSGTTLAQVRSWFTGLIRRSPKNIPARFRLLWFFGFVTVLALLVTAVFLAIGLFSEILDALSDTREWWNGWKKITVVAAAISAISGAMTGFLQRSLGDAVRYLTANPENIAIRNSIRQNGMKLLRKIHESGDYDRVVVVGHSLGAVIGYDLIRLYWSEVNTSHRSPGHALSDRLEEYEAWLGPMGQDDGSGSEPATGAPSLPPPRAQHALWEEQRRNGNQWLITDFITLGSPLTYAELLIADDTADLREKQFHRELPTCPPATETQRCEPAIHYTTRYRAGATVKEIKILNHGAPFGVTRWTNIYFQNSLLVFGDPVGGPARPNFGGGIEDAQIDHHWRLSLHSCYWKGASKPAEEAKSQLLEALRLDSRSELERLAASLPAGERLRASGDATS